jgi:hypothetical protein
VTLDGLASLKRAYSWVRGRPKIVGHVQQLFLGNVQSDAGQPQAMVLMLTYIVNKHIAPVKIRKWQLTVKKSRREWPANQLFICENMIVDWSRDVYWAQGSQLYGADTTVGSKKGIRGWLLFVVPGVNSIDPGEKAELKLLIGDSCGGRHTIKSSSIVSKALVHRFRMGGCLAQSSRRRPSLPLVEFHP